MSLRSWRIARCTMSATSHAYMAAMRAHPLMERWYAEAAAEPEAWRLEKYENPA